MKQLLFVIISFISISFSLPASAEANDAIQQLNLFIKNTQTLKAKFSQVLINNTLSTDTQPKTGEFYLSRPGLFRWNYQKPYVQEIVSNGKRVWFYDVDLEQVTIKNVTEALSMGPALLLSGKSSITERFALEPQSVINGVAWLKLVPKEKINGFKSIRIGLKNNLLVEMVMGDEFDQVTHIRFVDIVVNPKLTPDLFEFKIPEGVDVISE